MSFPRYPKYKPSGVGWLGDVPDNWDVCALKRIVSLKSGDAITADSIRESGEFPVFGGNGVRGYTSRFTHDGHYAVVGRQGALCGNINYARGRFWASEHAVVAVPLKLVAIVWLGEMLRAMNLNQHSVSAAQPGLSMEFVGNLRTIMPPISDQKAISAFLGRETAKIDELVAEQRRLIELLKEKRQAVISRVVTKGLNSDAPLKPAGIEWLGDVPEHWKTTRIANLFRESTELGSDELPILRVSIHDGVSDKEIADEDLDRKITRSDDRSKYKKVRPNDLVYNMMRAWQGAFGNVKVHGMVSPAYIVARPRRPVSTQYVEHLLRTPQAVEQVRRQSRGITDFRLRLYWDEFKNIRIPVPPHEEAVAICESIREMDANFDALTAEAERAIELLQERRNALISAAVTGKIDVRGLTMANEGP